MSDCMTFPDTVEEYMEQNKVVDTEQIYSNGIEFVPIFRMQQWFEHLPSAEPEIIFCKDCRKHNQGINEAPYLADRCPLILHRGYAQGHEFDYQYCVYAERRTDE